MSFFMFEDKIKLNAIAFTDKFSFDTHWNLSMKYLNRIVNKLCTENPDFDFYESLIQEELNDDIYYRCILPEYLSLCLDQEWISNEIPHKEYRLIA